MQSADRRWRWMARVLHLNLLSLLLVASCAAAPRGEHLGRTMLRQRQLTSQLEEPARLESARGRNEAPGKIAFLFLTRRDVPLARVWEAFFTQSNGRASVYVHVSDPGYNLSAHVDPSSVFYGRQVGHVEIEWGGFGMVHAEKKLFHAALQDPTNQRFVLVSESCIPIRSFDFVYSYLTAANKSFITSHSSTWRLGGKRLESEIPKHLTRKGSQWIALTRPHAELVVNESHYIKLFMEIGARIPDETYVQTVVPLLDPGSIEPRGVTFVQWKGFSFKWKRYPPPPSNGAEAPSSFVDRTPPPKVGHPRVFYNEQVTVDLLRELQAAMEPQVESISKTEYSVSRPCQLAGKAAPCYLFARKFAPETVDKLLTFRDVLGY